MDRGEQGWEEGVRRESYGGGGSSGGREDDGLEDAVVLQVDPDEFGAAVRCGDDGSVGSCGPAGVENPESVGGIDDDGLYADEVVLVIGARWGRGRVVDSSARGRVDLSVRIRRFGRV